jgi:hypothetical protein
MWTYKGFVIKPYVVIRNGYKYSILEADEITHVASARTIKEMKQKVNQIICERKNK